MQPGALPGVVMSSLVLLDKSFGGAPTDARVQQQSGDIADPAVLRRALAGGVHFVFHLASVPGGLAERDYALGYRVNLQATHELFVQLREKAVPAVVVFASSIAVYGARLPDPVDEAKPADPQLSHGAHKRVGEVLLREFSRRGWIDGRALRLPGVGARPRGPSGLLSAYMSDIQHALAPGEPYPPGVGAGGVVVDVGGVLCRQPAACCGADHRPAEPATHLGAAGAALHDGRAGGCTRAALR